MMSSINDLLSAFESSLVDVAFDVEAIKTRVEAILKFLNLDENNTDENCRLVNNFMLLRILGVGPFQQRMKKLPKELSSIIEDMGMCLHDTHTDPEIARNFRSTPDEFYQRLQGLTGKAR